MSSIVDIRYCKDNGGYYMVLGSAENVQKGAYRVLWDCGLRSHDFKEDIIKDHLVKRLTVNIGREKNRWDKLISIINAYK